MAKQTNEHFDGYPDFISKSRREARKYMFFFFKTSSSNLSWVKEFNQKNMVQFTICQTVTIWNSHFLTLIEKRVLTSIKVQLLGLSWRYFSIDYVKVYNFNDV